MSIRAGRVTGLDAVNRKVMARGRWAKVEFDYDYLILAAEVRQS
jgi:NADH dehydrogenase FAD-containing subunit